MRYVQDATFNELHRQKSGQTAGATNTGNLCCMQASYALHELCNNIEVIHQSTRNGLCFTLLDMALWSETTGLALVDTDINPNDGKLFL